MCIPLHSKFGFIKQRDAVPSNNRNSLFYYSTIWPISSRKPSLDINGLNGRALFRCRVQIIALRITQRALQWICALTNNETDESLEDNPHSLSFCHNATTTHLKFRSAACGWFELDGIYSRCS